MTAPKTGAIEAAPPVRLADEVALRLRRYMIENGLGVGDRLPSERQLSSMLNTSRATVSQALRTLSITGLVAVRQGSGAYLRSDPASSAGVAFDLVEAPEQGSGAELADLIHWVERALVSTEHPPRFDVPMLRRAFTRLEGAGGAIAEFIEADAQFHLTVMRGVRNRYFVALFEEAHRRIHQLTYSGWVRSGVTPRWLEASGFSRQLDLHRRIMDAALSGDTEDLALALGEHHRAVETHLDAAMHRAPAAPEPGGHH